MKYQHVIASHLLREDGDDESTQWTEQAMEFGAAAVSGREARTAQFAIIPDGDLILIEAVGQAPDKMKWRQGLRPARLRFLNRVQAAGIDVLLAFWHPNRWERAWLSTLPDPEVIVHSKDGDPDSARVGWYAGEREEDGVFWTSETLDLADLPPRRLPRPDEYVWPQDRLVDAL